MTKPTCAVYDERVAAIIRNFIRDNYVLCGCLKKATTQYGPEPMCAACRSKHPVRYQSAKNVRLLRECRERFRATLNEKSLCKLCAKKHRVNASHCDECRKKHNRLRKNERMGRRLQRQAWVPEHSVAV